MADYGVVPSNASLAVSRLQIVVPEERLSRFKTLLSYSELGPKTYENHREDGKYGMTYAWMSQAKEQWENQFDWRSIEAKINSFPNFTTQVVDDDGSSFQIHFTALFSQKKEAIPVLFLHGWPGSFLEFQGVMDIFKQKYTPESLPFHVVVPSLPGYAFSQAPPLDRDWKMEDSGRLMHKLMVGLGFEAGYAAQGGDIGSYISRIIASTYSSCRALHLNFCVITCPDVGKHGELVVEDDELQALARADQFVKFGTAYAVEHATRPATIGFALASSPMALLAWIGEKFLTWSDKPPSVDKVLESVTMYWLTQTFPTSIYTYRQELIEPPASSETRTDYTQVFQKGPDRYMTHKEEKYYCTKPMGYSWFPKEIAPVPKSWAATTGNLVWHRRHKQGGHFAAMEEPASIAMDIEDFLGQVWGQTETQKK